MQIEMIAPVSTASAALPRLGFGILAALTPPGDEIIYTDEVLGPFDLERDVKSVDLVAISVDSKTSEYKDTIAMLHAHGIAVWGSFVFGFDTDDPEVFDRTADFAVEMKLTAASFAMLCPYPGTALYRRLAAEQRLPDPAWWLREYRDQDGPHFVPKQFSATQLREGWMRAAELFYSWRAMWRRYTTGPQFGWIQRWAYWPLNVAQHQLARRRVGATRRLDLSC